jgi:hypothetical protein
LDHDQDIRLLGERDWKNLALNREEWRKVLKKARAHTGCLASDDDDINYKVLLL